jgi:hypothetical protein
MSDVTAVKVRKGLYELRGVTHTEPRRPGEAPCGGQVFAEWFKGPWDSETDYYTGKERRFKLPDSWECYCEKCQDCDPNGWPTLADCVREAPAFWMADVAAPT